MSAFKSLQKRKHTIEAAKTLGLSDSELDEEPDTKRQKIVNDSSETSSVDEEPSEKDFTDEQDEKSEAIEEF